MKKKLKLDSVKIDNASRRVYGLIITLALIISLEGYVQSSFSIIISILGTLFVIALAETYVKYVAETAKKKQRLRSRELIEIIKEEFVIMFSSEIPVLLFFLEIINIISIDTAFFLSKVLGIFALFVFGFILGCLLEKRLIKRIIFGSISAIFGLLIIALKIIFK